MRIDFQKWHGTGNDFILIDDRSGSLPRDIEWIRQACDRHFGIGSDGLIFLAPGADFRVDFYNPDGSQSFCGNGSRCAFAFHAALSGSTSGFRFEAIDGSHAGEWVDGEVGITMRDVTAIEELEHGRLLLDTGSPHLMVWVDDPEQVDVLEEGRSIRYSDRFKEEGVNVNFLSWKDDAIHMRTYERGVEAETLSCGTGVTAAGICAMRKGLVTESCPVVTRGGQLRVQVLRMENNSASGIKLVGPAQKVFEGYLEHP